MLEYAYILKGKMMQNTGKLLLKVVLTGLVYKSAMATGMAVGLDNLLIQNNTNKALIMEINNLPKDKQIVNVKANSICELNQNIAFLPEQTENNSFVIMLKNGDNLNPIVIDKDGKLALASYAKLKFNYHGDVKRDQLLGYCDNKLQQNKFLSVDPENLKDSMPVFKLKGCTNSSNFVYVVNTKNGKIQKKLDISKIAKCSISN